MKQNSDKQRNPFTLILKIFGAVLCLIYFLLCLYAGITGKISYMQSPSGFGRGGRELTYRWATDGLFSSLGFALFIHYTLNDMKLWMWRKRYSCLIFAVELVPGIFLLLLGVYRDLKMTGICLYIGITVACFVIPNIPGFITRQIAKIAFKNAQSNCGKNYENHNVGKMKQIEKIEWIKFYPVKKAILSLVWLFFAVVSAVGTMVTFQESDFKDVWILVFFIVLTVVTFKPIKNYVTTPYHCMPCLNKILSRKEIENLTENETLKQIDFSTRNLKKYVPIYDGEKWFVIRGVYISKKLGVVGGLTNYGKDSNASLEVLYLNGESIKINFGLELTAEEVNELEYYIKERTNINLELFLVESRKTIINKIIKQYSSIKSELKDESEKVLSLLRGDIT